MELSTEKFDESERKHFEMGYQEGVECADPHAMKHKSDDMIDACDAIWASVTKKNPYTAQRLGAVVTEEDIRAYDKDMDNLNLDKCYWLGVAAALNDRL